MKSYFVTHFYRVYRLYQKDARLNSLILYAGIVLLPLISISQLQATSYTWVGGNGNWYTAANWSPMGIPGIGDNVMISSGTVTMDIAATINDMDFSGGILSGVETLSVNGTMTWSSSDIKCPLVINAGGVFNINMGASDIENQLINNGVVNQSAGFSFQVGSYVINNKTWNQSAGNIQLNNNTITFDNFDEFITTIDGTTLSGPGTFHNHTGAVFTRSGGTGILSSSCIFINDGTIDHDSGSNFHINALIQNATLNLNAGVIFKANSSGFNVPLTIDAGQTLVKSSGNVAFNDVVTINGSFNNQNGSEINGTGNIIISNGAVMNWSSNDIKVPVNVKLGGVFNINTGASDIENQLINNGVVNQSAGFSLQVGSYVINNKTWNQSAGNIQLNNNTITFDNFDEFNTTIDGTTLSGPGTFHNHTGAVFTRSGGTGILSSSCIFINDGTINHDSGSMLDFNNYLMHNGSLNLNSGTTLETASCTFNSAFVLQSNEIWELKGSTIINTVGIIIIGEAKMNNDVSGIGKISVSGVFRWLDNDLSVDVDVQATGGFFITSFMGSHSLCSVILIPQGGFFSQSTDSTIDFCLTGAIANLAYYGVTGTSSSSQIILFSGTGSFGNEGTFENTSSDNVVINSEFDNFSSGAIHQSNSAGIIDFNSDFINSGTISGSGTMNFSTIISWTGITSPGDSPGILAFNKLENGSGTLEIEIAGNNGTGDLNGNDRLDVTDAVSLSGVLDIILINGFSPVSSQTYTILTCPGGCTDTFDTENLPNPAWSVIYNANDVQVFYDSTLPVETLDFTVITLDNSVLLRWSTALESNNSGFEILKSDDGTEFANIGWVSGSDNKVDKNNYKFEDHNVYDGRKYYYLLKQIDHDGTYSLSEIKFIQLQEEDNLYLIKVFPNPVSRGKSLEITFNQLHNDDFGFSIISPDGQRVFGKTSHLEKGVNNFKINKIDLPQGIYFLRIENSDRIHFEKLIVND